MFCGLGMRSASGGDPCRRGTRLPLARLSEVRIEIRRLGGLDLRLGAQKGDKRACALLILKKVLCLYMAARRMKNKHRHEAGA